jgi:hypothetical protein
MELAAWIASALVFMTFFMKTMLLLRAVAIASNVAFITYAVLGFEHGIFEKVLPILVLHLLLLPLNVLRIYEMNGSNARTEVQFCRTRRARIKWANADRHARPLNPTFRSNTASARPVSEARNDRP